MSASNQIVRFLRANPHGHLYITVGYASTAGLAWLNEHTRGQPVTLVIGNAKKTYFTKATTAARSSALEFLARPDVQVRNWYRTSKGGDPSEAHAKAWMVWNDRSNPAGLSVMLGSANLTKQGLFHNVEMMALVTGDEATRLWTEMHNLISKSWDINVRIERYLAASDDLVQHGQHKEAIFYQEETALTAPGDLTRHGRHSERQASLGNRTGCARRAVLLVMGLVGLVGSLIALSVLLEALGS